MRLNIREQLVGLVLLAVLLALLTVAIPIWVFVRHLVSDVKTQDLSLTASLKAARISAELDLVQSNVLTISSGILLRQGFWNFYAGQEEWNATANELRSALSLNYAHGLLQARLYSRNATGNSHGLLNVTAPNVPAIQLPYSQPNNSNLFLSDSPYGYPQELYPNITYEEVDVPDNNNASTSQIPFAFDNVNLSTRAGLLLGPLSINDTYALMSITVPIHMDPDGDFILGYLTIVSRASSLINVATSREGLGKTGIVLVAGPLDPTNRFNASVDVSTDNSEPEDGNRDVASIPVHYLLPPIPLPNQTDRHPGRHFSDGKDNAPFTLDEYPALLLSLSDQFDSVNNASALLATHNERNFPVAVGFARTNTTLANWTVLVELARDEVFQPMGTLAHILLATVFGAIGALLFIIYPCAHLSVRPIRQLRQATKRSIEPPGYDEKSYYVCDDKGMEDGAGSGTTLGHTTTRHEKTRACLGLRTSGMVDGKQRVGGPPHPPPPPSSVLSSSSFPSSPRSPRWMASWMTTIPKKWRRKRWAKAMMMSSGGGDAQRRRNFKIPSKVPDRKHLLRDELTDLTFTFNSMSDELMKQYTSLDEKVAERTRELEISKKAAEAANESKTLFIANISHELKTPLNGILGMCSICMEEEDIDGIKKLLKTLYKSGELLLHLLEDLLSFSKNQIGQQLHLEEKEFRLGDIRAQIVTIFDKQVREGRIHFVVDFLGGADLTKTGGGGTEGEDRKLDTANKVDGTVDAVDVTDSRGVSALPTEVFSGKVEDLCLWGDQHRILQVIINLVSNSLKFTPPGGRVHVRIRCLGEVDDVSGAETTGHQVTMSRDSSFSRPTNPVGGRTGRSSHQAVGGGGSGSGSSSRVRATGTALSINPVDPKALPHIPVRDSSPPRAPADARRFLFEFEVEDTGPGIAEHFQDRVFEPFVQGDLGLSRRYGGTGLGLSICQQLAGLMGGAIRLRSQPGHGSTFTMQIPLRYVRERPSSMDSSLSLLSSSSSYASYGGAVVAGRRSSARTSVVDLSEATAALGGSFPPVQARASSGGRGGLVERGSPVAVARCHRPSMSNGSSVMDRQSRLVGLCQPYLFTGEGSDEKKTSDSLEGRGLGGTGQKFPTLASRASPIDTMEQEAANTSESDAVVEAQTPSKETEPTTEARSSGTGESRGKTKGKAYRTRHKKPVEPDTGDQDLPSPTARLRVLVADDNKTNIEVVSRMLKLEDVRNVTFARDGQEAYERVRASMDADERFDLILMDVQMPVVDGLQSTRLIRQMGFTRPIVALTAFSEESNVRKCMESGMNEFLSKPIRRPELKKMLSRIATILEEPDAPTHAS